MDEEFSVDSVPLVLLFESILFLLPPPVLTLSTLRGDVDDVVDGFTSRLVLLLESVLWSLAELVVKEFVLASGLINRAEFNSCRICSSSCLCQ